MEPTDCYYLFSLMNMFFKNTVSKYLCQINDLLEIVILLFCLTITISKNMFPFCKIKDCLISGIRPALRHGRDMLS